MSTDIHTRLTPEDLLALPDDGKSYELVDGELVKRNMSLETTWVAGRICRRLSESGEDAGIGWAYSEGAGFQCFQDDPERVRKADVSFIRRSRQPEVPTDRGLAGIAPDLVVEVVSPYDVQWEVGEKVSQWLKAGVSVVWEVMPRNRTVTVHRSGSKPEILCADEEITLPDLIPQFCCRVAEFFPPHSSR